MEQDNIEQSAHHIFNKVIVYGAAIIVCAIVAMFVMQFLDGGRGESVSNEHIVLTFIGILATFIVVGNFSQVNAIKDDFGKQVENVEAKIKTQKDDCISEIQKMGISSEEKLNRGDQELCSVLVQLIATEQIKFIYKMLTDPTARYSILCKNETTTKDVFAECVNDSVAFYTKNDSNNKVYVSDEVEEIDGVAYDAQRVRVFLMIHNNHRSLSADTNNSKSEENNSKEQKKY